MAYLKCLCGSGEFIRWSKLKQSQAGGTVEEIGGWQCANPECLKKADTGAMLRQIDMESKLKELRELTEEIKNGQAVPKSAKAEEAKGKTEAKPNSANL